MARHLINSVSHRNPCWEIVISHSKDTVQNTDYTFSFDFILKALLFFLQLFNMCDYQMFRGGKWGLQVKVVKPNLYYVMLLNSQVRLVTFSCLLSASSLSGTWWSGTIRSTSPSLSSWRKIQPSRSTGAGSVSSTARTAPACNTSATLWTSDLPELQDGEISREDVRSGLTSIRGHGGGRPGLIF